MVVSKNQQSLDIIREQFDLVFTHVSEQPGTWIEDFVPEYEHGSMPEVEQAVLEAVSRELLVQRQVSRRLSEGHIQQNGMTATHLKAVDQELYDAVMTERTNTLGQFPVNYAAALRQVAHNMNTSGALEKQVNDKNLERLESIQLGQNEPLSEEQEFAVRDLSMRVRLSIMRELSQHIDRELIMNADLSDTAKLFLQESMERIAHTGGVSLVDDDPTRDVGDRPEVP